MSLPPTLSVIVRHFRILALVLALCAGSRPVGAESSVVLPGHIPAAALHNARLIGAIAREQAVPMAFTLPLRDPDGLQDLIAKLYDPGSPEFGRFLTPEQFTQRFGPTESDYQAVIDYARRQGFVVTGLHPNRTVLDVEGTPSQVESSFSLRLNSYVADDGRVFQAPDNDPRVPASVANIISGVVGLSTANVRRPHIREITPELLPSIQSSSIGNGPSGGLTPNDIKTAYNLFGISSNGNGQVMAVFELDGYSATDITQYESQYALSSVPLQNIFVDGATGHAGSSADESTLDIELEIALAPGASKIMVYQGPNTDVGIVDTYNRIVSDNQAKEISTSWGQAESLNPASTNSGEYSAFQQMAAQGQSVFAAAGDNGAYDDGTNLSVDDPASQPFVCGVGGTRLSLSPNQSYLSESSWNGGSSDSGGGGISATWSKPSYQSGFGVSGSMRNVPDVALSADPNSGYSIYFSGTWHVYGGTSAAAPLWAAFTALVNQQRTATGSALVGFVNPALYHFASSNRYGQDFHDINDGTTNLYYAATTGYDDSTGWGSFNGVNLFNDLTAYGASIPTTVTVSPSPVNVPTGGTQQFSATAFDQNNVAMKTQPAFAWSVSGGGTINASTGLFTAGSTAGGPYTVTATGSGVSGTGSLTVMFTPLLTSITVSPLSVTMPAVGAQQFTATARDQNGNPLQTQPPFAWTVSGGGTINASTGLFTAGGVAGGPFTVMATRGGVSGTASVTLLNGPRVPNHPVDFNGDGHSDLVLQNSASNQIAFWYMNGPSLLGGQYVSATPGAGWEVIGQGDFNGDGKRDLVLQNRASSQIALWYLSGAALLGGQYISATLPTGWVVVGANDFNGDGRPDLLLLNTSTRQIAFWYLNGATVTGGGYLSLALPANWSVIGTGDFNGDGRADLALLNSLTSQVAIWYLNGTSVANGQYVSLAIPSGWTAAGVGDFSGDGIPDLVLRNPSSNQLAYWYLNGAAVVSGVYISATPASGWSVVAPK